MCFGRWLILVEAEFPPRDASQPCFSQGKWAGGRQVSYAEIAIASQKYQQGGNSLSVKRSQTNLKKVSSSRREEKKAAEGEMTPSNTKSAESTPPFPADLGV
jgi:hypothetical protein